MNDTATVVLGVIVGAKGIKGEVRIKAFTEDPMAVGDYGPVRMDARPEPVDLKVTGTAKGVVIGRLADVTDRNAAEALRGQEISVLRRALPEETLEDGEFFHADLIGLTAQDPDGEKLGSVIAVYDFGAGDILEIEPDQGQAWMVAFTAENVPSIDVQGGFVVIDRPAEITARGEGRDGD